jgi:prenyltransferase beta subunit
MRQAKSAFLILLLTPGPLLGQGLSADEEKATRDWVLSLQTAEGGFTDGKGEGSEPTLKATAAALLALRDLKSQPKEPRACEKFVLSCYDKENGGFAARPGGKADVASSAAGLLAVHELRINTPEYRVRPVVYLCAHAKKPEQFYQAAAAYDALGTKCELSSDWAARLAQTRVKDGGFGKGDDTARHTAGAVVTLIRLGETLGEKDALARVLTAGQRKDGGWGAAGEASDLETSHRAVRALVLLGQKPGDARGAAAFVGKCRNADGGYSLRPGGQSTMQGTRAAVATLRLLGGNR